MQQPGIQFPKSVEIKVEPGNKIIKIHNRYATAQISLFGAQVIQFQPQHDQRERLWLSPDTKLNGTEAIRGGAPLCWPWFANMFPTTTDHPAQLPSHGFLRSQIWQLTKAVDENAGTRLYFSCLESQAAGFQYKTQVSLEVFVGATLDIALKIKNTDDTAFVFTGAIHTYFAVRDIHQVQLHGLSGLYQDKTKDMKAFFTPETYKISEEVDRIHDTDTESVIINQTDINARTQVEQSGHDSIVVWNPWHKAKTMANIPDSGYLNFLCVECAITQGKELLPTETHVLRQTIS